MVSLLVQIRGLVLCLIGLLPRMQGYSGRVAGVKVPAAAAAGVTAYLEVVE